jgi:hypothetical protein
LIVIGSSRAITVKKVFRSVKKSATGVRSGRTANSMAMVAR